jgi:[protein-PII] uridylyltransferase
MHELGVLELIIPSFERLTCLKRHDLYHQYTADEHSLQAITYLEELGESEGGLLPRIYGEVAEKTELFLATLLHDIGKVNVRGHARTGAAMAEKLLRDFPISKRSRWLIIFLIGNHLLLSHFSQRRDMEDRDTCLLFIRKVKNHLNLKLLYILTYTDLKATGMGVWNGWKENLLEDLYFSASRMLAEKSDLKTAYGRVLSSRREKALDVCKSAAERKRMEQHLEGLPARYTMVVSPAQARDHLGMASELRKKLAVTSMRRLRHSIELTICTRDRPFRLSQLCGVITINDLNILGAYAFTRDDGIVIDLFHVEGVDGRLVFPAAAWERINKDLNGVLGGKVDLEQAYIAHVKKWRRLAAPGIPVPPSIEFENDLSKESTIIDVSAKDRPGLLYRITHILSDEGIDIQSAQITTRGGLVADSFYVRTAAGGKMGDVETMRKVRRRLMAELDSGTHP